MFGNIKLGKYLLVTLIISTALLSGCNESSDVTSESLQDGAIVIPVTVSELQPQTIEKTMALGGLLKPKEEVTLLGGGTGSRIEQIYVEVGSPVTKGQVILTQDLRDLEIQQSNLELNHQDLLDNLEKTKSLFAAGAATQSQVTALENQIKSLELQLDSLQLTREKMQVTSTIRGIVSALPVVEGQLASAQTPVATIVNIDTLLLDLQVGESYIGSLREGQNIEVIIPALDNYQAQGKIVTVPPNVDPRSKAYIVTVEIDNPKHEIKGGMYAEVALTIARQENALAIPQFAIVNRDNKALVFVVENGQAQAREVEVGMTLGNLAEITSGLEPGAQVIIEGQYAVAQGTPVNVVERQNGEGEAQ